MTMRQWILTGCAVALLASAQMGTAQTAGQDFGAMLDRDVATGRLTAEQAEGIRTQYLAAAERINANIEQAGDALSSDVRRSITENPEFTGQVGALSGGRVASSPGDIRDQATAVYAAGEKVLQINRNLLDKLQPVLAQAAEDLDRVVAQRSALISRSPNASVQDRHDAQALASRLHDASTYTIDHHLSMDLEKLNAAESYFQNHKADIISTIATVLKQKSDRDGPIIANWPKQDSPAPGTVPAPPVSPRPAPQARPPAEQAPAPVARPAPTSATATRTTLPQQAGADPALSTTRNGSASAAGSGGAPARASNTSSAPSPSSSAQSSSAGARAPTPSPRTPSPPAPPPPPRTNPLVIPPTHLIPMTVAAPPPERLGNQSDDTAVTIRDPATPPPSAPDGRGVDPAAPTPASSDASPVAMPTQSSNSNLPAPVQPRRGTVPSNAPDPAFDAHRNDPNYNPNAPATDQGVVGGQNGTPQGQPSAGSAASASAQGGQAGQSRSGGTDAAGQAAASAMAGASLPSAANSQASEDAALADYIRSQTIPGNAHLVGGGPDFGDNVASLRAMLPPAIAGGARPVPSVEYGGTLTVATLASIYVGYDVDSQPGAAMRSLDLYPPVPSPVMIVPSNQMQVPSTWITIPSTWVDVPSLLMMSLDLQPALCGR